MSNQKACTAVSSAVKRGEIPSIHTQKCIDCGKPAKHYDHRDYDKPLDVEPVCMGCNDKRGRAAGTHDKKPCVMVVSVSKELKKSAMRKAKKKDLTLSQLIRKLLNECK